MKTRLIALFIAAALSAGAAQASEPAKPAKPATAEQKAAQAEIDKLVERIKVLSTQLGEDSDVRVIVRKGAHGGPGHDDHERMMWHEGQGPGDGMRKIRIETIGGEAGKPRIMHGDGGEPDVVIERIGGPQAYRRGPGLGIVMAPNPAAAGVRIAAVSPDSPAQKAGLRADDVLLSVDGKKISSSGPAAVESARKLLGNLKQDQVVKLRYARQGKSHDASVKAGEIGRVFAFERGAGMPRMPHGEGQRHERIQMLPPGVKMEIERVGPMRECAKGEDDCGLPVLYQAFRWQGLNLASLDAGLGRYFGTDKGVLVLSAGPELKALQSGDVIRGVAGSPVQSPRDVMRALRSKDAGTQLKLDVMRDRKATTVTVTVPESRPLPFMEAPLAPPASRALPRPQPAPEAPEAAPPAPPAPPRAGAAI